ncbi:hypothetical protein CBS115989_51 [Aspergillus niger]|uniref:COP9 signalosome complex subunit 6 n=1 Tax=Aspergillus niger ATCC 13496 TaxID=1353008 RepID=A0A370BYH7_ASPNG|nr:COP9 signalosome complex subunit 6 [Aspergillus niger CBS 513.88]KAI2825092.1 hypothetical protein CBS115989_51 [Aspergillus niger]KAI2860211.1 hypothetical protein CBS11232_1627 [Aspergillus niger]KAI2878386.1 hypothetical protein CBS115988_3161 [Aspergillus niger]RDH20537.1 COP9 signalosome complex subunit 6 [Aspergillus niger ATCC 13496]|eukprot:XP_001398298.2 COP9 signalosome complex subunit 6 [Aspergillus niger CBS 513.88]
MSDQPESLLSPKNSDSGLHIQLHPLILLTISDHITRHAARSQQGPIVGALLGQQNGREITLEHVFECIVNEGPNGDLQIPQDWFVERVKQFKDVHKAPALDLVGWWSTAPPSGPNTVHLPIHRQILHNHNESAVFLAFHPSLVQDASSNGGKLPVTIYESVYEGENATENSKTMQVDGEEQSLTIRFRELPYSVETGEAEMIGVDTVARTARNAAADTQGTASLTKQSAGKEPSKDQSEVLSPEEEELIASLTTRLNAIKTLESRISLIKSYVASNSTSDPETPTSTTTLSHPILRNINALLSHLSLLTPDERSAFTAEAIAQSNDVHLVSLLGQLGQSISAMRELGKRTALMNSVRRTMMSRKTQQLSWQNRFTEPFSTGDGVSHG